jgi:hypothetical protein
MNQPVCDPTNFVVFTDAAKYLDWIQNHIKWQLNEASFKPFLHTKRGY